MNYEDWKKQQALEELEYQHAAQAASERAGVGLAPPPDSIAALVAQHTEQINALMGQLEHLRMQLVELQKRTEPESIDRMLAQRIGSSARNPGRY